MTAKYGRVTLLMAVSLGVVTIGIWLWVALPVRARPLGQGGAAGLIHYQGLLTDSAGAPLAGPVNLQFEILDGAGTDAQLLWQEAHTGVPLDHGYFSVQLGSITTLDAGLFDSPERYLQVRVNGGEPLPRQRFASVPYALQAQEAKHAANADSSVAAEHAIAATLALSATTAQTATVASTAAGVAWSDVESRPPGLDDGDDDSLAALMCGSNQVAKWNGNSWECADDADTNSGGDITAVSAGNGLSGGGDSGTVALDVVFEGSGAAAMAARSDHLHEDMYQQQYARTVVVGPVGTEDENGKALKDALDAITDATQTNPYLLKIEPGFYDLGSSFLFLKAYVDIEGSGVNVTTIKRRGENVGGYGVVHNTSGGPVEVRHLSLEHDGASSSGAAVCAGVGETGSTLKLVRVSLFAYGANQNYGVNVRSGGALSAREMTALAVGGSVSYGVYIGAGGTADLFNLDLTARLATNINTGIYNSSQSEAPKVFLANVQAEATGVGDSYGLYNQNSSAIVKRSELRGTGKTLGSDYYGVYSIDAGGLPPIYEVEIHHSILKGNTAAINRRSRTRHSLAYTQLIGGMGPGSGNVHRCVGLYDGDFAAYTCP